MAKPVAGQADQPTALSRLMGNYGARRHSDGCTRSRGDHPLSIMCRSKPTPRRGTGYYKVPSLRGVWYRSSFEHNGSVATLEDWFDERRLRDDYVPTNFVGYGVKTRAVRGHEFGLKLAKADKQSLIAFLKTL